MRRAQRLRSVLARPLSTASSAISTIKVPPILQIGGGSASSVSDTLKVLGCKQSGVPGSAPLDHSTGVGWVDKHEGQYDDALLVKRNIVIPAIVTIQH